MGPMFPDTSVPHHPGCSCSPCLLVATRHWIVFTVAHVGPPSVPVPSNSVSMRPPGVRAVAWIKAAVIPPSGIFARRFQHDSDCPALWPAFT